MTATLSCQGILCDLDGTLIDSGDAVLHAWTAFATRHGLDPAEILAKCHGVRTVELIEELDLPVDTRLAAAEVESYIINAGSTPIPGAVEFIRALPPDRWGVVTSSLAATAASRFTGTGLAEPGFIVSAEDVPIGKPDPSCYLRGAQLLGLSPAECVVVEDAPAGISAGISAGMQVIAVQTTGTPEALSGATARVPDLTHIRVQVSGDVIELQLD